MIISKTPLRMSFFGGGTDFRDYYENSSIGYGTVMSTGLNMYVYIMVGKRFDNKIRVCYTKNEFVDSVEDIKHNIIREALKITGIENGIDIVYSADIPLSSAGVGLASSSALAVGVVNALYAYQGIYATPELLAKMACKIEIDILGNPIGIQDQYAVAYGGFNQYRFWADGHVSVTPVLCKSEVLKELKSRLLLYYTGLTRISSEILSEQKERTLDRMTVLNEMAEMVGIAQRALQERDLHKWGEMLDKAWNLKKMMADKITNPVIEEMYNKAKAAGAIGGKILGAGGGGFFLFYVEPDKQGKVIEAMADYQKVVFDFEAEGSRIIFVEENRI